MAEELLVKMSPRPPADLCKLLEIDLDDDALALLEGQPTPSVFLRSLIEAGLQEDAIAYLAHGLPQREAVWWGCQCVRETRPAEGSADAKALAAAEAWVYAPDEAHRKAAEPLVEAAGMRSPCGLLVQGVVWSGGSLAPEGLEQVPPPEHLTAKMVSAAIVVAANRLPPQELEETLGRFLSRGIEIAMGSKARTGGEGPAS